MKALAVTVHEWYALTHGDEPEFALPAPACECAEDDGTLEVGQTVALVGPGSEVWGTARVRRTICNIGTGAQRVTLADVSAVTPRQVPGPPQILVWDLGDDFCV